MSRLQDLVDQLPGDACVMSGLDYTVQLQWNNGTVKIMGQEIAKEMIRRGLAKRIVSASGEKQNCAVVLHNDMPLCFVSGVDKNEAMEQIELMLNYIVLEQLHVQG